MVAGVVAAVPGWPAGEEMLGITAVARLLNVHGQTLHRWIRDGLLDASGRPVRLAAVMVGSRWRITRAALLAFLRARGDGPDQDAEADRLEAIEATRPRR